VNLDTYDRVHGKECEACEGTMRRIIHDYDKEAATHRPIIENVLQCIGNMKCDMWEAGIEGQCPTSALRSRRVEGDWETEKCSGGYRCLFSWVAPAISEFISGRIFINLTSVSFDLHHSYHYGTIHTYTQGDQ